MGIGIPPRRHLYIKTVPASLLWPYAMLCLPFHLDNIVPLSKRYITFTLVLCSDASWLSVIPLQRLYHTLSISATATTGGNAGGASCVFPFTYNGVSYTTCIIAYNGNTSWCATTNNYPSDQRWGNCRKSHLRSALKTESCCDTNLIVNGSTGGSRDDPRCHQWRQSWNHDDSRFSVGTLDRSRSFYLKKMLCLLQQRHNERHGVSNHRRPDSLLNCLFRDRSEKTSKLCVTGFCEGNSPMTGEFPAQRASDAENVSIWWRHHVFLHMSKLPTIRPDKWGVLCQKQVSRAGTSNYMPHILWGVITCAYPLYLLQAQHSWNMHMIRVLLCFVAVSYRPVLPYPSGLLRQMS